MNTARQPEPTVTHLRLIAMPQDETEDGARIARTETAGPPSSQRPNAEIPPPARLPSDVGEPKTLPPPPMSQAELDAEAEAIRGSLTPAGIAKSAADTLIKLYQHRQRSDYQLLDPEGQLARQQRQLLTDFKVDVVRELSDAVRDITGAAVARVSRQVETLARGQSKQGEDIDELKREFVAMRDRLGELEKKIQDLDARTPQPTGATTPA